ncbi:MAG: hypothetical protein J0L61_10390, partial [Planctomycetes bacterium]|nr:hypothetical protein [Planctomycetota bacterium]
MLLPLVLCTGLAIVLGDAAAAPYQDAAVSCADMPASSFVLPPCQGDFDGDRAVSTSDLVFFIGRFGAPATIGSDAERADFSGNGVVDTPDLVYFIGRFGRSCPASNPLFPG